MKDLAEIILILKRRIEDLHVIASKYVHTVSKEIQASDLYADYSNDNETK